jgi:arginine deiminase
MYWPARRPETLLQRAVYKFHPTFKKAGVKIWWGDSDESFGMSTLEGGDVMPVGKGVVLIGMGERTTRQAVYQVAGRLFEQNAAERVIGCLMPKSRAAMHLDTVFSFCDRDLVTAFREVADQVRCYSCRPDGKGASRSGRRGATVRRGAQERWAQALRVVETGGNAWQAQREQWDDGNNVVALEPGVVSLRPQHLHQHVLRKAGVE